LAAIKRKREKRKRKKRGKKQKKEKRHGHGHGHGHGERSGSKFNQLASWFAVNTRENVRERGR
jgi:hypothetical protein